jgi:hypothetical protein
VANSAEPRFVIGLPAPLRLSNYLPQQAPLAYLQQIMHDLGDREATKQWLD